MPLYTAEINALKKELMDLRRVNKILGYDRQEKTLDEYSRQSYCLSSNVIKHLDYFRQEVLADINVFARGSAITDLSNSNLADGLECVTEVEEVTSMEDIFEEDSGENYFNAPELELIFNRVESNSYRNLQAAPNLLEKNDIPEVVKSLDKIFSYELLRIKNSDKNIGKLVLTQKISKVQEKIRANKINEASVLMSRFYTESSKDIVIGYLYFETLYAKAALGNQKSLPIARDVANTVCFLTDRSDESLVNYYRYMYICREFAYDKDKALQLFRDFVLISQDKLLSNNLLIERNGFYLKTLILFLMFDFSNWNSYEVESMEKFSLKSISGGLFYLVFMRSNLLPKLGSKRFGGFLQIEIELDNIYNSHKKVTDYIHSNFNRNGIAKSAVEDFATIGQKFARNFFLAAKAPSFSEYLANTSLSGIQYLSDTINDNKLASIGISEYSFWRIWISKIISETSLQRPDLLPIERVVQERDILVKYKELLTKMYLFEKEIYDDEKYLSVKDILPNTTQKGIVKVILGENIYSVFDYGTSWNALKDYYNNIKLSHEKDSSPMGSELLLIKGKNGMFWNLEEVQMMLESLNLILDNKNVGIQARLDNLLEQKNEDIGKNNEYMSLSEHLELYWWCYILLISILVFMFNML